MLVLHIRRLGQETLANKVYQEQKTNLWPGLVKETEEICEQLSIESVHNTNLKSKAYRKKVLKACHKMNEQRLRKKADGKKMWTDTWGKLRQEGIYKRQLYS